MTHLLAKVRAEKEKDREEWVEQKTVVQSQSKKVRVIHLQLFGLCVCVCLSPAMRERTSSNRRLMERLARVEHLCRFPAAAQAENESDTPVLSFTTRTHARIRRCGL